MAGEARAEARAGAGRPLRPIESAAVDLDWVKQHLNSEPVKYGLLVLTTPLWLPFVKALWRALNDSLRAEGGIMGGAPTRQELKSMNRDSAASVSPLVSVTWEQHERGDDVRMRTPGGRRATSGGPLVRPRGFRPGR